MELLELADRIERAEGPDRKLDARIWWETYGRHHKADDRASWQRNPASAASRYWPGWEKRDEIPHLTASIDAALTLVPEGAAWWRVEQDSEGFWSRVQGMPCQGATPALALCSAALRARATQDAPQ